MKTSALEMDRRLAEMICHERHLVVDFVIQLADFARRELHRDLGYGSLFLYCLRQLGLSRSSAFRRSEAALLVLRFPAVAQALRESRVSVRSLVELREVLSDENCAQVLARAEGMNQEEAQLLAVEYKPRSVPRDVVRVLPLKESSSMLAVTGVSSGAPVSAETRPPERVDPLTVQLRRMNVTVTAEFIAELEQVRAALSHVVPDGDFERVVREGFKLILARDRRRKGLTRRPRPAPESAVGQGPSVPAAIKRTVWQRDQGRCVWPMGDGKPCGESRQLQLDHILPVALGGTTTAGNLRLLCRTH